MIKLITFIVFFLVVPRVIAQNGWVSFDTLSAKEKAERTYKNLNMFKDNYDEFAFMSSQLKPTKRTIFLSKLPDVVAIEVKKLKFGEFTQPLFADKAWYIVKLEEKLLFRYKLNIIYFNESNKLYKKLPKN